MSEDQFSHSVGDTPTAPAGSVWNRKPKSILKILLWIIALAPCVFFVLAVQHSAIVFPFWDHCELIGYFAKIHDHTLKVQDLWAPHNHSRTLVLRSLLLLNGLLNGWDIRSEYLYLIASVIGAFLLQALCLRRLYGSLTLQCLAWISLLSIVSFSPVGHNNHWWSFMIQLDLTHLFVVVAFLFLCLRPGAWINNIFAAIACWLATYTLSNGLVAFMAAILTLQLIHRPLFRPSRFVAFWVANLACILAVYLPGLAESGGKIHARTLIEFSLAYLGSPLGSLVSFPFQNMFDVPQVSLRNGIFGTILAMVSIYVLVALKRQIRNAEPAAMLFVSFSAFAVGSAMLTAWGRAEFDAVGVANANASRYSIFGTYLIYGLIYAAAAKWRRSDRLSSVVTAMRSRAMKPVLVTTGIVLIVLASRTYAQSVKIYDEAYNFNQRLAAAFLDDNPLDQQFIFPNAQVREEMKANLRRLAIGPYRYIHSTSNDMIDVLAVHKIKDQFGVDGLRTVQPLGRVLFANPTCWFALPIPDRIQAVRFEFGIVDTALLASPLPDGVIFRLVLKHDADHEQVVWSRTLTPVFQRADRGVQVAEVHVSCVRPDSLLFETLPVGNPISNWAYWRNVVIDK